MKAEMMGNKDHAKKLKRQLETGISLAPQFNIWLLLIFHVLKFI